MDLRKLQRVIVDALEDIKGQDIKVFNTAHLSDMFERVIIASGTSNRQTRSLASSVVEKVKAAGGYVVSTEGEDSGEWVLVDCGDAVVHILQPTFRAYYNLEEIWGGKPVRMTTLEPAPFARPSRPAEAAKPAKAAKAAKDARTAKTAKAAKVSKSARSARTATSSVASSVAGSGARSAAKSARKTPRKTAARRAE